VTNSTFKRKAYVRTPVSVPVPVRQVAATIFAGMVLVQAKECVVASEPYRRLVALFPCKICGIDGYSQAAHPNTDKGAGIKTDDRLCFPLCCDRPGVQGWRLGLRQQQRRLPFAGSCVAGRKGGK
jgi:hypothetical protein